MAGAEVGTMNDESCGQGLQGGKSGTGYLCWCFRDCKDMIAAI